VCQKFELEKDINPAIANLFAGGLGNTGAVCGAVAGAVMAIGLKRGRGESMEDMMANLAAAQEFRRRFEAEMESINCRELTGLDLTTQEGLEQLMSSAEVMGVCFTAVGVAYKLAVDLLEEAS
jgi:C_GCAxxG_C_C family probable redox protein